MYLLILNSNLFKNIRMSSDHQPYSNQLLQAAKNNLPNLNWPDPATLNPWLDWMIAYFSSFFILAFKYYRQLPYGSVHCNCVQFSNKLEAWNIAADCIQLCLAELQLTCNINLDVSLSRIFFPCMIIISKRFDAWILIISAISN